jgi:hypothetical protein
MLNDFTNLSVTISPDLLWGILAIFLLFFITVTIVLQYHWKYYGIKNNPKIFTKSIHWIISLVLILTMTFALLAYESYL